MAPNQEGQQTEVITRFRVTVIGSGNWGSVATKLIASNTLKQSSFYVGGRNRKVAEAFARSGGKRVSPQHEKFMKFSGTEDGKGYFHFSAQFMRSALASSLLQQ